MTQPIIEGKPPPKIRLWLDDCRPLPAGWDRQVQTAPEAIALLASRVVAAISLDHDLGPAEAGTGYDVARWIEEAAYYWRIPRLDWHLHTDNPVGRERMRAALINADRFWEPSFRAQFAAEGAGESHFTVEDVQHAEVVSEHASLAEALEKLRALSRLPWNRKPHIAPCADWKVCGRDYVLNEYETCDGQRRPVKSTPIFDITRAGLVWHVDIDTIASAQSLEGRNDDAAPSR